MERLPEEMVTNILSRLAVKNILQIRCVCKSWNTIISHPNFSKSQLEQSNKTDHNQNLLILSEISEPISVSSDYENGNDDCKFTLSSLNFPVKHEDEEDIVILSLGSCNGLLCFEVGFEIVIWNPSIRQYKVLPKNGFGFGPSLTHGFGYDSLSDDYKVVGATVHGGKDVVVVNVFSLKTNSWRCFEDPSHGNFAYIFGKGRNFLNGSLHWSVVQKLGRDRDRDSDRDSNILFVAFSLAEEKFLEVPLPDAVEGADIGETCVFDGCLCLSRIDEVKCGVEIWVMKEYMVKASWTQLFKLLWPPRPDFWAFCLPLYSSSDGDVILELEKRCVLKFNIKEKRLKTVIELEENDSLQVLGYVESLVSPNFDDVQRQLL